MDEYIPLGDIRFIFRIYIINEEICKKTMQIHLTNKKAVQLAGCEKFIIKLLLCSNITNFEILKT